MKRLIALAVMALSGNASPDDWSPLFNGRDLSGWIAKVNHHGVGEDPYRTFEVRDGILHVQHRHYHRFFDQFAHLYYRVPFASYRLRLDYRFIGQDAPGGPPWTKRNSGVMIYSQPPATIGRDQPFPVSVEVQLLNGVRGDGRTTGNVCTPGTNVSMDGVRVAGHCAQSNSRPYWGESWVHVEIEVHSGRETTVEVDGREVLRFDKPALDPTDLRAMEMFLRRGAADVSLHDGYISLQGEGHPIDFRNIAIRKLPD